jgi:hypothetical protein
MKPLTGRAKAGTTTLNALTYSHFIHALMQRPCTRADLQAATGMGVVLVCKLVNALRARGQTGTYNDVLHIETWKLDARGYPTLAAYRLGPGVDAPQPKKTRQEVVRTYLAKLEQRGISRAQLRKQAQGVNA